MKRIVLVLGTLLAVASFMLAGCGNPTSSTPAATTPATSTAPSTTAPASTSTSVAAPTPKYGGTLVIVCDESIDAMGYPAEAQPKGFLYYKYALPIMETLVNVDTKDNIIPGLAE